MKIWATRLTAILVGLSMLLTAAPGARAAAPAPPPPPALHPRAPMVRAIRSDARLPA